MIAAQLLLILAAVGPSTAETVVVAILSSSVVGGIITLLTKKVRSPEAENDLARLGNEFAHQLLADAKSEREELRLSIRELEDIITDRTEAVDRLRSLLEEKDAIIQELEVRQIKLAGKLQAGVPITLQDIFGKKAPSEFQLASPIDPEPV